MRSNNFRSTSQSQSQNKRYRAVPPGKKLIFRWSRTDPRTGQTIYARGRPFPILVDDTPQRSVAPLRVVSQPLRVQQARPVAVVQKPQPPKRPVYTGAGAMAGGVRAINHLPSGGTPGANFAEVLGGALGGTANAYLTAFLRSVPPNNTNSSIPEGATHMVLPNSEEMVAQLRAKAEVYRQRAAEAGQDGSSFEAFLNEVLAVLMHVSAGAVNGAPAGGLAQTAMESPSEANVKRLVANL
jgi:hypothetical protein